MTNKIPMQAAKKFQVKIKPLKLQGLDGLITAAEKGDKEVAISVKWKEPKSNMVIIPFYRSSSTKKIDKNSSKRYVIRKGESIDWDDDDDKEFENVCDGSFDRWGVWFNVLYGESGENDKKLAVLGKSWMNLSELAALKDGWIEKKIPITLKVAGVAIEATLTVSVSFIEIRSFQDSASEMVHNPTESNKEDGFLSWVTGYMPSMNTKKHKLSSKKNKNKVSSSYSDESATVGSELGLPSISETQLDPVPKVGFWKRRRLSFRSARTEVEPLIEKTGCVDDARVIGDCDGKLETSSSVDSTTSISKQNVDDTGTSSTSDCNTENCTTGSWEVKEIISRDGLTKFEANVFFASFDQCSQEAAGESACTTLSAVIAHWLLSNQAAMPTRFEFDSLITEGSSEWRKLCSNSSCSPDKYFDLDTILEVELRPLSVLQEKSFVGFFSPEKFESLKGIMSFDEIWNDIDSNIEEYEQRIYIVSWNDHFFVLKMEADAYYIIDTLGGRLFEGCDKAYILKFDDSTIMYGKAEKEMNGLKEMDERETTSTNDKEEKEETIYTGKECCREFIKRFLAAIPVKELEEEEKKGTVSTLTLLQRLQIEFQYTSSPPL